MDASRGPESTREESVSLYELLKLAIHEQQYWLSEHQKRTAFFSSILMAALTATATGVVKAERTVHWIALLVGPILLLSLSSLGAASTALFYELYSQSVAARAKLEQALGLTSPGWSKCRADASGKAYWSGESLVPKAHIEKRLASGDSATFVDAQMKRGYHARVRLFFRVFTVIGFVSLALIAHQCVRRISP